MFWGPHRKLSPCKNVAQYGPFNIGRIHEYYEIKLLRGLIKNFSLCYLLQIFKSLFGFTLKCCSLSCETSRKTLSLNAFFWYKSSPWFLESSSSSPTSSSVTSDPVVYSSSSDCSACCLCKDHGDNKIRPHHRHHVWPTGWSRWRHLRAWTYVERGRSGRSYQLQTPVFQKGKLVKERTLTHLDP